jgi:alpha-galactosidase
MKTEQNFKTVLAPVAVWNAGGPVINGPDIAGASPGKEVSHRIPTVGERPIRFSAEGLPAGLTLDSARGLIIGRIFTPGDYPILLKAENRHGTAEKAFKIRIGENSLALTPPMGWNSWNCFRSDIDAAKITRIAEGMIQSGLAAHGYTYVNLDSGWQSKQRGGRFNSILPHAGFPDMAALCAHLHSLGLKMGIYSGPYVVPWGTEGCGTSSGLIDSRFAPWPNCAGKYIGLTKHELEDVSQWADWGIDYFKYDWAQTDMETAGRMSRVLRQAARDIVFSVTTNVKLEDAREITRLCNLWRSNGDTHSAWDSVVKNGFGNEQWNPYIGPGHWFDLDMTAILPRDGKQLTENELIACFSCWALRPSPLLIDCIPDEITDFTRNLLCNDEVIAVNQDILGQPAAVIIRKDQWEIQLKPLVDGSYAVGVFNLSDQPGLSPEFQFASYGFDRDVKVRDLWAQRDLEGRRTDLTVAVDAHCAKLFRASL